ncbi:major histocompatibility complex class I-related gene protein-like [Puntigrus tetrazona]|uniref:major histocompatibility complex class I-related gene protein-like n=1 Tax=Puntigrus tetrazona TaxID=1606681 RepID=UPI001C8A1581|nr:major histocompatibility complex class I-related gene protein-like [Puntigrus tetrazona]
MYFPKGNKTNEDGVIELGYKNISSYMYNSFTRRSAMLSHYNYNVYQTLVVCELLDLDRPGKMIIRDAAGGCTTDEMCYFNNNFTYTVTANITQEMLKPHLEEFKQIFENTFYPVCIKTLRYYLNKRRHQLNIRKPEVSPLRKNLSSGSRLSCLATGFYPRHINLTLFRDQQPVADHEITGGDLLPNDDGTYQMRKSLEISAADKHKYTCSVTHLSLDNKLDVSLESSELITPVVSSVLIVLGLLLVSMTALIKPRVRPADGYQRDSWAVSLMDVLCYWRLSSLKPFDSVSWGTSSSDCSYLLYGCTSGDGNQSCIPPPVIPC